MSAITNAQSITYIRCVQRPTREGSEDVQAAGRRVSTRFCLVCITVQRRCNNSQAVASPCRIEKQDTEAVIDANLAGVRLMFTLRPKTHEDAAKSVVPRCPIDTTEARTRDHSAAWVKKTGRAERRMIGSSAYHNQLSPEGAEITRTVP